MATSVGQIHLDLMLNHKPVMQQAKSLAPKLEQTFASSFKGMGSKLLAFVGVATVLEGIKSSINIASDLIETQNVVDVTFGKMADSVNDFASSSLEAYGLAELSAKKYASTMGAMLKASGLDSSVISGMSIDIAKLSADMASFYNLENDASFSKIMSGLSGMSIPLKELGVDMNIANLEAFNMSRGITTSFNDLTQAQKVLTRYQYLLSVTGDAQGDFGRNSETWANQTKILAGNFKILKGEIGVAFISLLQPVVKFLNIIMARLISLAKLFSSFITSIFGVPTGESGGLGDLSGTIGSAIDGVGDLGDAYEEAGKKAKNSVTSFDEVHQLQETTGAGGIGGGLGGDIGGDLEFPDLSEIIGKSTAMDDFFKKVKEGLLKIAALFKPSLDNISYMFRNTIENIKEFFKPLGVTAKTIAEGIKESFIKNLPHLAEATNRVTTAMRVSFDRVWARILTKAEPFAKDIESIFMSAIRGFDKSFPEVSKLMGNLGEILSLGVESAITTISTLFFGIVKVVSSVLTPVFEIIASIIYIVVGSINDFWDIHGKEILDTMAKDIEEWDTFITGVFDTVATYLGTVWQGVSDWFETNSADIRTTLTNTWTAIYNFLSPLFQGIKKVALEVFGAIKDWLDKDGYKMRDTVVAIFDFIWAVIKTVLEGIQRTLEFFTRVGKKIWDLFGEDIIKALKKVVGIIGGIISFLLDTLTSIFRILTSLLKGEWSEAWAEYHTATDKASEKIKGVGTKIKTSLQHSFETMGTNIKTSVNNMVTGIKDKIGGLSKGAYNWGRNLLQGFIDGIKSMAWRLEYAVDDIVGTIKKFLGFSSPTEKGAGKTSDKWSPNLMNMFIGGIEDAKPELMAIVDEYSSLLANLTPNTLNSLSLPAIKSTTPSNQTGTSFADGLTQSSNLVQDILNALLQFYNLIKLNEPIGDNEQELNLVMDGNNLARLLLPKIQNEMNRLGIKL